MKTQAADVLDENASEGPIYARVREMALQNRMHI